MSDVAVKDGLVKDSPVKTGNGTASALSNKVWNLAHVLRDQGLSYGDYLEQITLLLFLKMAQERSEFESSVFPPNTVGQVC